MNDGVLYELGVLKAIGIKKSDSDDNSVDSSVSVIIDILMNSGIDVFNPSFIEGFKTELHGDDDVEDLLKDVINGII